MLQPDGLGFKPYTLKYSLFCTTAFPPAYFVVLRQCMYIAQRLSACLCCRESTVKKTAPTKLEDGAVNQNEGMTAAFNQLADVFEAKGGHHASEHAFDHDHEVQGLRSLSDDVLVCKLS